MATRGVVFSGLRDKFYNWLSGMGVDPEGAGKHYRDSIEAIGELPQPHTTPTGKWFGMYKALTGEQPKPIYSVTGIVDFARNYGKAVRFFTVAKSFEEFRETIRSYYPHATNFDALYDFAYTNGDNGHTRNGFSRYLQFLYELESQVDAVSPVPPTAEVNLNEPLQQIVYGAPGTGKSFSTDGKLADEHGNPIAISFRTTFHPDSDYSTFVGAYKPMMVGEGNDRKIVYDFRPQAFMNAYVAAWKNPAQSVVLIVEEINRGNCAQVFGDLFQLLDRGDDGYSTYPIDADSDLAKWLGETDQFGGDGLALVRPDGCKVKDADWSAILKGQKLCLPPNLYIWATMNTSDQSLFPIDSAFKRRWDWKYVPIVEPDKSDDPNWRPRAIEAQGKYYDWWTFITIINHYIEKTTKSEDKQLGYFFVKAPDSTGVITADQFVNKVLFYLFGDVFRDWKLPEAVFGKGDSKFYSFKDFFGNKIDEIKEDVVVQFLERLEWTDDQGQAWKMVPPKTAAEHAAAAAPAEETVPAADGTAGAAPLDAPGDGAE